MLLNLTLILAISACLWLWRGLRMQERNRAGLFEDLTGDAVIAFDKSGSINSIGPRARMIFGFEGRVDPLMLSDIPVPGFMSWLAGIESEMLAGEHVDHVNRKLCLDSANSRSRASKSESAGLCVRLACEDPNKGVYPAFASFALLEPTNEIEGAADHNSQAAKENRAVWSVQDMDFGDLHDQAYLDVAADFLTDLDYSAQALARSIESEDWESVESLANHMRTKAEAFDMPEIRESTAELLSVLSEARDRSAAEEEMKHLRELVSGVSGHVLMDTSD